MKQLTDKDISYPKPSEVYLLAAQLMEETHYARMSGAIVAALRELLGKGAAKVPYHIYSEYSYFFFPTPNEFTAFKHNHFTQSEKVLALIFLSTVYERAGQ